MTIKAGGAGQAAQAVGTQTRAHQLSRASASIWAGPCGSVTSGQWAIHKSSLLLQASGELKLARPAQIAGRPVDSQQAQSHQRSHSN